MGGKEGEQPSRFRSSYKVTACGFLSLPLMLRKTAMTGFWPTVFTDGNRTGARQGGRSPGLSHA